MLYGKTARSLRPAPLCTPYHQTLNKTPQEEVKVRKARKKKLFILFPFFFLPTYLGERIPVVPRAPLQARIPPRPSTRKIGQPRILIPKRLTKVDHLGLGVRVRVGVRAKQHRPKRSKRGPIVSVAVLIAMTKRSLRVDPLSKPSLIGRVVSMPPR
jgi:hypothetical protein